MTDLRQAAQQALEALRGYRQELGDRQPCDAEQALDAALAEQAEPDSPERRCGGPGCDLKCCQPVQEPVAKVELMMTGGNAGLATRIVEIDDHLRERLRPGQLLYTAPPQRKPLSEEEIQAAWDSVDMRHPRGNETRIAFARAVERAHGIVGKA